MYQNTLQSLKFIAVHSALNTQWRRIHCSDLPPVPRQIAAHFPTHRQPENNHCLQRFDIFHLLDKMQICNLMMIMALNNAIKFSSSDSKQPFNRKVTARCWIISIDVFNKSFWFVSILNFMIFDDFTRTPDILKTRERIVICDIQKYASTFTPPLKLNRTELQGWCSYTFYIYLCQVALYFTFF